MAKTRLSLRSNAAVGAVGAVGSWALALTLAACAGTERPPSPATADARPVRRRPDGVVLESPFASPEPVIRARAASVIALREPRDDEELREIALAYVRAFQREDLEALTALLTTDAVQIGPKNHGTRGAIVDAFRQRLRTLDYTRLSADSALSIERLEVSTFDDLGGQAEAARPAEMRPDDVVVRIPVATPRVGGERLFGEALVFLLRRETGRLRIAGLHEEDSSF